RRERTEKPGQYALDLVADAAVLPVLHEAGVAVASEESGRSGTFDASVTVVLDPVDGSTNCSRDIPYWSISLCALDRDGPLCALVANQATGVQTTAVRGKGAWRDGELVAPSGVRRGGGAGGSFSGAPARPPAGEQFRSLRSAPPQLWGRGPGALGAHLSSSRSPPRY